MKDSLHLCLVSCYPPSRGPLSEYTYHLAKNLSKIPMIAKITILADKTGKEETHVNEKIKVVRCWKLNDPLTPLRILMKLREIRPHIVHFNLHFGFFSSNRLTNFFGLCTPTLARLLGFPIVTTLHNIVEAIDLTKVGHEYTISNKIGCYFATKVLLKSHIVTLTRQRFVDIYKRLYKAKNVVYVSHGIFESPKINCDSESKSGRLLVFGKMGPYKNPILAIEAFKEINSKNNGTELIVAGTSHSKYPKFLEPILEKYEKTPKVRFLGYIPEDKLESIFASSAAVILPYLTSTGASGVFHLACTYGTPVIASDLPDFQELLEEGAGILLFPRNDKEALAKAMELILDEEELRRKLGKANLEWATKNNQVIDKFVEIYEKLTRE